MINVAVLIGKVGKKETKTLKNGGEVTTVTVVTTKTYKDAAGNNKQHTTWHKVNCFHKLAEVANKNLKVGDLVYVQGEIQNPIADYGATVGQHVYSITASTIKFIPTDSKQYFKGGSDDDNCGNY